MRIKRKLLITILVILFFIFLGGVFIINEPLKAISFFKSSESETSSNDDDIYNKPFTFSTFRELAKEQYPTVVNIRTTKIIKRRWHRFRRSPFDEFFGDEFFKFFFGLPEEGTKIQSLGSGVIIDEKGHILTNYHVIENVDDIRVILYNGEEYKAKVVGTDPLTDLALIKGINMKDFKPAKLGDSDKIEVGDWVMAIGNPFGYGHTVTVGVISAKERVIGAGPYDDFIQTDASINPGNSGGPLFNIKGEVIGINTAIATRTGQSAGIGFAIPINMAKEILDDLMAGREVKRGWLGVYIQEVTKEIAEAYGLDHPMGALVVQVEPDSPAERAGFEKGDLIIEYDGKVVKNHRELTRMVGRTPVGKKVKVKVIRDNREKTLIVKIGKRPSEYGTEYEGEEEGEVNLGLTVQEITPEIKRSLDLPSTKGVIVTDVEVGSPADEAGFMKYDVILEINRQTIDDMSDYRRVIRKIKPGENVLFYIRRGKTHLFIGVKAPEK